MADQKYVRPDKVRNYSRRSERFVNKENIDRILKDIDDGCTKKHAAESNSISEMHFYNMVNQGRLDAEMGIDDTLDYYMWKRLREIEKRQIIRYKNMCLSNKSGHQGAEFILKHAYWRSFGQTEGMREMQQELDFIKAKVAKQPEHEEDN